MDRYVPLAVARTIYNDANIEAAHPCKMSARWHELHSAISYRSNFANNQICDYEQLIQLYRAILYLLTLLDLDARLSLLFLRTRFVF